MTFRRDRFCGPSKSCRPKRFLGKGLRKGGESLSERCEWREDRYNCRIAPPAMAISRAIGCCGDGVSWLPSSSGPWIGCSV